MLGGLLWPGLSSARGRGRLRPGATQAGADWGWVASGWADSGWAYSGWTDAGWTDAGWTDAGWTDAGWVASVRAAFVSLILCRSFRAGLFGVGSLRVRPRRVGRLESWFCAELFSAWAALDGL
ncbi:hypothetical protein GCM10010435_86010 [Winogradskya consettensis]|uniref:Uncharacterized protein n=1 Tax=Winogradskya consettensis TaxID=113560 RepID=A0A919SIX4_9ACTN|nr:hypothetical protein Aco04nite_30380 [Actinoplanes consettensis]